MEKAKILFVSIRNASRTQMAEGFCKAFYGDEVDVYSAGSDPQEIEPTTILIMDEIGIDISNQTSNSLLDLKGLEIDYVVMICGNEYNVCPIFVGGGKYFKKPLKDIYPFKGTESEKIELLREIRDEIGDWVQEFHYYMNGESNTLTIADCCELLGADDDGCCDSNRLDDGSCCDLEETNSDCCSPTDSTKD
ncbi:MAG: arsenate reductase ArsC [Methanobacterium sp.]